MVGATHIRGVDTDWPDAGAELHHQVGAWPITISDSTQVVVSEPPDRLVLHARAWPAGAAEVVIEIEAEGAGSRVHMWERPTAGPAKWLHTPVQDAILRLRNAESLNRLASIAENRPIEVRVICDVCWQATDTLRAGHRARSRPGGSWSGHCPGWPIRTAVCLSSGAP